MDTIIVVDFGTSAVKSFLYNLQTGTIIGSSEVETNYFTPEQGAAETDAESWWEGLCKTVKSLITEHRPTSLKGISITNQQISCVFLDEFQKTVSPALLWMDTRCTSEINHLTHSIDDFSEWVLQNTGIPPSDSWGLAKLLWFRARYPEKYPEVKQVASVDSFIAQKLTGRFVSDETNACFFHLDINRKTPAYDILNKLNLELDLFPEIVPPGSIIGNISEKVASDLMLPKDLPIILAGSDQPCAMVGMGVYKPGEAVINLGSGSFLLTPLEAPFTDKRLMTNISSVPNQWLLMGTHYVTGVAFRWLRDLHNVDKKLTYAELDSLASQVKPGADGLIFLPSLSGSGTPLWDAEAKGLFAGIGLQHQLGHMSRAVMESTGYGLKNILDVLNDCDLKIDRLIIAGGATVSQVWNQSIADILGMRIEISTTEHATPLGAAIVASVALERFSAIEEAVLEWIQPGEVIEPNSENGEIYEQSYRAYLAWRDAERNVRNSLIDKNEEAEVR